MTLEVIGWTGSLLASMVAPSQAVKCYKQKHSKGVSLGALWFWFFGEACSLTYISLQANLLYPLLFNYGINLIAILVILYFYYYSKD